MYACTCMYMVPWPSSHDSHDCVTHDCQMFTTTTEASQSSTHDHDWFQSFIIFPGSDQRTAAEATLPPGPGPRRARVPAGPGSPPGPGPRRARVPAGPGSPPGPGPRRARVPAGPGPRRARVHRWARVPGGPRPGSHMHLLYLMECFKYAFNILNMTDEMF